MQYINQIILNIRKRYWRKNIIDGGMSSPFVCGLMPIPAAAYLLFSESELAEIENEKYAINERIQQSISEL